MLKPIKLCQAIVLALILLVSMTSAGRIFRLHRSVEEAVTTSTSTSTAATTTTSTTPQPKEEMRCQENTPCGWAIYTPFTRKVDYFMKNTCVCSTETNIKCVRTDDDLSVSAYVYRCRQYFGSATDTNSS